MAWVKEVEDDLYGVYPAMTYADELRATGIFARVTQRGSTVTAWRDYPDPQSEKEAE